MAKQEEPKKKLPPPAIKITPKLVDKIDEGFTFSHKDEQGNDVYKKESDTPKRDYPVIPKTIKPKPTGTPKKIVQPKPRDVPPTYKVEYQTMLKKKPEEPIIQKPQSLRTDMQEIFPSGLQKGYKSYMVPDLTGGGNYAKQKNVITDSTGMPVSYDFKENKYIQTGEPNIYKTMPVQNDTPTIQAPLKANELPTKFDVVPERLRTPSYNAPKVTTPTVDTSIYKGFNEVGIPNTTNSNIEFQKEQEKNLAIPKLNKGGVLSKIKGYYVGGEVEDDNYLTSNPNTNNGSFTPSGNKGNFYQNQNVNSGVVGMNDQYTAQNNMQAKKAIDENKKKANQQKTRNVANGIGEGMGGIGSAYYNSQPAQNEGESARNAGLAAASQMGPIGGMIGGIAAIGDKIGKPIRNRSEKVDASGELLDEGKAKRNAAIGITFSPSKRLTYEGGLTDITGQKYIDSIEKKTKAQLAEVNAANAASKQQQAILARNNQEENPTITNPYNLSGVTFDENQNMILADGQQFDKNRPMMNRGGVVGKIKNMYADGGEIKGKGTAKSDSIMAEVKEGSFVVPAENAELAKGIRKLYLKAPNKKANLKQEEGEAVKLSNGEHLFTPEENEYLESIGIELEDLAPNSENNSEEMIMAPKMKGYAAGGDVDDNDEIVANSKKVMDAKKEVSKLEKELNDFKKDRKVTDNNESTKKLNDKIENDKLGYLNKAKGVLKDKVSLYESAKTRPKLEVFNPKENKPYKDNVVNKTTKQIENEEKALVQRKKDLLKEYADIKKDADSGNIIAKTNLQKKTIDIGKEIANVDKLLNENKKTKAVEDSKSTESPTTEVKQDVAEVKAATNTVAPKAETKPSVVTENVPTAKPSLKAPKVKASKVTVDNLPAKDLSLQGLKQDAELKTANQAAMQEASIANAPTRQAVINDANVVNNENYLASKPKSKNAWADKLSNIDPTAFVGIGQSALGLNMLGKEKRPIDKAVIDPTYNAAVNRAQQDALFGLTPEQRFMAEQDIQGGLNDAKFAGLNSSASDSFNRNRAAINDAWKNKLGLKQADAEMRMNKQKYADVMAANRATILAANRRQAYNDAMNTFQQKQKAGSELIGAGLMNTIDAYRFKRSMEQRDAAEKQKTDFVNKI